MARCKETGEDEGSPNVNRDIEKLRLYCIGIEFYTKRDGTERNHPLDLDYRITAHLNIV